MNSNATMAEITLRGVILAIILTVILAMSNAYLALKLGLLTSASIPAAIVSMGILRFFKRSNKLENNAVQTAASAGEAVAGGIVYTIPALIIIGFWHHFDYWSNVLIALCGGVLGVLFSIPLRRILVHDKALTFPEGRAIAEILNAPSEKQGMRDLIYGGIVGGLFELFQVGFKLLATSWMHCVRVKQTLWSVGAGFSSTMIGAGYLIGIDMACSLFLGALLGWFVVLPIVSHSFVTMLADKSATDAVNILWNSQLRYVGIGAMLFSGIWTLLKLIRPLAISIRNSLQSVGNKSADLNALRTEKDIPMSFLFLGIFGMTGVVWWFFTCIFPTEIIGVSLNVAHGMVYAAVFYVLFVGFLFAVITAYFSGMVGVTASPGSSIVIAGILFAAWLLFSLIKWVVPLPLTDAQLMAAEAIVIIIGSVVTGIAAIANDNSQDLKVGHLVGATPWRQQVMLLLGVVVASLVIPPVMQLLFEVYGIAGVMPHAGMDLSQALPAPTAAMLAAITQAVFHGTLPWGMMSIGAGLMLVTLMFNRACRTKYPHLQRSILGVAIGLYLPFSTTFPLFIGGLIAWLVHRSKSKNSTGTRIACGLVTGSALIDVILAIPFSIYQSSDALRLVSSSEPVSVILSVFAVMVLGWWIRRRGV